MRSVCLGRTTVVFPPPKLAQTSALIAAIARDKGGCIVKAEHQSLQVLYGFTEMVEELLSHSC